MLHPFIVLSFQRWPRHPRLGPAGGTSLDIILSITLSHIKHSWGCLGILAWDVCHTWLAALHRFHTSQEGMGVKKQPPWKHQREHLMPDRIFTLTSIIYNLQFPGDALGELGSHCNLLKYAVLALSLCNQIFKFCTFIIKESLSWNLSTHCNLIFMQQN